MTHRFLTECLCCGSSDLRCVIDLGVQPPANSYSTLPDEKIERYPLGLNLCASCWHAQLTFCVDRSAIFDHYAYVSGTSGTLDRFFRWFSQKLSECYPVGARVLELAANDGSLLTHLMARHFDVAGVDPARNIVDVAKARGLPITCGYWPDVQDDINGKFDVIICMNVVAHVDDPGNFVSACVSRLRPGGVLIIQPSQARMFENGEFDTIYHEHISFFNTRSMAQLAERAGLRLYGAALVAVHGDSPIYFLGLPDSPPPVEGLIAAFSTGEFGIPEDLPGYEQKIELYGARTYERFERKAKKVLHDLVRTVEAFRAQGQKIAFVGAAAKAFTVINACGIRPDHLLDEAPMKIGKFAPGVGTLIEPLDTARSFTEPMLFVITAWNFRKELKAKLLAYGVPTGSAFYSYFPQPELTRAENQMRPVICHFFNEAYLLPWWMQHHVPLLDHGVMIDHGSTDGSADIIRQYAPHWRLVHTRLMNFNVALNDLEVMRYEEELPGWKIALNITEFLVNASPLADIEKYCVEKNLDGFACQGFVAVDLKPEQLPRHEERLLLQKPWAIDDNKITGAQQRLEAGFTQIPERNRFYHRDHVGMYLPGQHRSFHPVSTRQDPNVLVAHFQYSPCTAQLLRRKLQILDRVDPKDLARGWGIQHTSKADQLERERQKVIPLIEDLRNNPISSRSAVFRRT